MSGLDDAATLPVHMIVVALYNLLFQDGNRLVSAGMCIRAQLEDGMEKLHGFVKEYYERGVNVEDTGVSELITPVKTNEWSMSFISGGRDNHHQTRQQMKLIS